MKIENVSHAISNVKLYEFREIIANWNARVIFLHFTFSVSMTSLDSFQHFRYASAEFGPNARWFNSLSISIRVISEKCT